MPTGLVVAALAIVCAFGGPRFANQSRSKVPGFAISCTPGKNTITAGSAAVYTVTVKPIGPWINALQLVVDGLPNETSAEFFPNPISTGNYKSALRVATTSGTTAGTYTLSITAQVTTRNPTGSSFKKTKCKLRIK